MGCQHALLVTVLGQHQVALSFSASCAIGRIIKQASMLTHRKAALAKCAAEALLGWPWPCPWTGPANIMQGRLAWQARRLHGHTMREHDDFPNQLACLDGVRGVLRLAGSDIIHFLQVSITCSFTGAH